MENNLSTKLRINKFKEVFIVILAGLFLGKFILNYTSSTPRFIVSYSVVLIIVFIGMIVKNPRRFFLGVFFFSLPIVTFNYVGKLSQIHYGGSQGFYNTFYDFPLLLLYLLWIPKIFFSKTAKIHFRKLDLCILGLIGMSFLSMYNAVDKQLCLYEIFRLIIMYFIFFYMANAVTTKRDLKFIIIPILAGLFLESLLGIFQHLQGGTFGMTLIGEREEMVYLPAISRVGGTLGHPNSFAAYLGFFLPLTIILFFAPIKKVYKFICGLIFLVGVSTLILTLSRGGWGAFIISLIVLFFLGLKAKLFSLRRRLSIIVLSIILMTVVIFALQGLISTRLISDDYGAAYSRIPLMKVAMNIIRAQPFLGIGINNYSEVMQNYDNTAERISFKMPYVVHNSYLLIASEIGIPGLFFFLWFVTLIYKKGIKTLYCKDSLINCIVIGILAGISGALIHFIVENVHLSHHVFFLFWVLSGLIVALNRLGIVNFVKQGVTS